MSGGERERCMREREIEEAEPRISSGGGNPVPFGLFLFGARSVPFGLCGGGGDDTVVVVVVVIRWWWWWWW